jgi:hypothetical protein
MKQLVSDWLLNSKPESQSQHGKPPATFSLGTMCTAGKIVSDESKLLILTHLYLELHLGLENALRAAKADLMITPRVTCQRLWGEQTR